MSRWIGLSGLGLLCFLVSATGAARPQCKAPPDPVAISSIPTTLTFHTLGEQRSGWLLIAASDATPWDALTLSLGGPLTLGNNHAFVKLTAAPEDEALKLSDPRAGCKAGEDCRLEYTVSGVSAHGTYSGTVELVSACGTVGSTTLKALLDTAVFQPSLSGDAFKNGKVDTDVTNAKVFTLTVAAADTDPSRTYLITAHATKVEPASGSCTHLEGSGASSLHFDPDRFDLEGGQSRNIEVTVPDCLLTGTYKGAVRVADTNSPQLAKDWDLVISKTLPADERRLGVLTWVVLGALLSVIINNVFPISRARQDRFEQLRDLQKSLAGYSSIGPGLTTALVSESRRLWLLIDGISVFNPRKDAVLASATQSLQDLSKRVELAGQISRQYSDADLSELLIRTRRVVNQELRDAEDAASHNDMTAAASHLAAATQLIRTEPALASLVADLQKDIATLLKDHPASAKPAGRPPEIQKRLDQMGADAEALATMSSSDVIAVERDFYIASVWTDTVEFAQDLNGIDLKPIRDVLLETLIAGPVRPMTQRLISLMEAGISPLDLEEALRQGQARIECDQRPRYLDLIDFRFALTRPQLTSEPAALGLLEYQWRFDDNTTSPDAGAYCKHFFLPRSRQKWWSRKVAGTTGNVRTVTLTVRVPVWGEPHNFTSDLTLRDREGTVGISAMQVTTFVITTATAVLAAFGAQYSGVLPTAIDWGVGVTAFMFGFGIDQVRDRTTNA